MTDLLVLGGERVAAADGTTFEVIEPATAAPDGRGGHRAGPRTPAARSTSPHARSRTARGRA